MRIFLYSFIALFLIVFSSCEKEIKIRCQDQVKRSEGVVVRGCFLHGSIENINNHLIKIKMVRISEGGAGGYRAEETTQWMTNLAPHQKIDQHIIDCCPYCYRYGYHIYNEKGGEIGYLDAFYSEVQEAIYGMKIGY